MVDRCKLQKGEGEEVYVFRTVDLGYVGVRALCELTAYWRLCMCVHVPYDHAQRVCDDVWCALW